MKFNLIDRDLETVNAWRNEFVEYPEVNIIHGDFFSVETNCIVSPANSYGFMDGGLDLVISQRFGWDLQARVQHRIISDFYGELLVGQALTIETNDAKIPYCIVAPTMRIPEFVPNSVNAYLAMRAVLIEAKKNKNIMNSISISGFCTGVGAMPPTQAANQMKEAYADIWWGKMKTSRSWIEAKDRHMKLSGWSFSN